MRLRSLNFHLKLELSAKSVDETQKEQIRIIEFLNKTYNCTLWFDANTLKFKAFYR